MNVITDVSDETLWKEIHKSKDSYKSLVRIITKNDEDILCSIEHTGKDSLRIKLLKKDVRTVKYKYIKSFQVLDAKDVLQIIADLVKSRDDSIEALSEIKLKSQGISKLADETLKKIK